jgi:hypothetical protein
MQKIEKIYLKILEGQPFLLLYKFTLIPPIIALAIVAFLLLPNQHFISYSDLPYYLSVSECIANGAFYESINAYWSPLYSWLLLPVTLNKDWILLYVFALTVLNMLFVLTISKRILTYFNIKGIMAILALCIIACYLILLSSSKGPDGILVTLLLWLLYLTLDAELIINNATKIGILGILLYLCKAYSFYFFIFYLALRFYILLKNVQANRTQFFKSIKKIIAIFAIGSIAWMSLLLWKYNKVMVSSVGPYAHAIAMPGKSLHNLDSCGLLFMPNQFSKNSTDDLAFTNPKTDWSPFSNLENFNRQWEIIKRNWVAWFELLSFNQKLIFPFYFLFVLQLFFSKKKVNAFALIIVQFSLLFFIGYTFISYEFRHLFILLILNVMLIASIIDKNNAFIFRYTFVKHIAMAAIAIAFVWPIYGYTLENKTNKILKQKADFIVDAIGKNKQIAYYYYPEDLISYINIKSDAKIFGKITPYTDSAKLLQALNEKQIDYVILDTSVTQKHFYYKNLVPKFQFQDIQIYEHKWK